MSGLKGNVLNTVRVICRDIIPKSTCSQMKSPNILQSRCSGSSNKDLRKFFAKAHITQVAGRTGYFEVNLDQRKLKTPMGNVFQVPGEQLAHAVAIEWNSQKEKIKRSSMHVTSLCNTAIDNPMQRTRSQIVQKLCHYLGSDTICYRMSEPEKLVKFQNEHWNPILSWFKKRFNIDIEPTTGIAPPLVPESAYKVIEKQLMSYSDWSLVGIEQCVDCLKSLCLTMALMEYQIQVPEAVFLSRLEQAYQVTQWGTVEWYHDLDVVETQARVAAALIYIHFCHEFSSSVTKQSSYSSLIG